MTETGHGHPQATPPGSHDGSDPAPGSSAASEARVSELHERYAEVTGRVADAARRSGRRPNEIILAAVTKYAEPDDIRVLYDLGHRDFGESRVPQLVQRAAMFAEIEQRRRLLSEAGSQPARTDDLPEHVRVGGDNDRPIRWHMIGHLQRNKARKVVEHIRLIHSLDTLRLAEELQNYGLRRESPVDVLIQVNISEEPQKYGCVIPAVMPLVEQIDSMVFVRARGLMCMAPYAEDPEQSRSIFSRARELFEEIRTTGASDGMFNILSMGMSGDYEVAIEEGANLVRVGSSLFGDHPASDEDDADAEASLSAGTARDID